jgi:hypothetical protein
MNTLHGAALVAMGLEIVSPRDGDASIPSATTGGDRETCWTDTAMTVLSLVTDPLSILGFPVRLSRGMAISQQSD